MAEQTLWHNISWQEVAKRLGSDIESGLDGKEVLLRRRKFGHNVFPKDRPVSKTKIMLGQFRSPLIYILALAGIIVLFFKQLSDAAVIFSAVFLNIIIGFLQENEAVNAIKKLTEVLTPKTLVLRAGVNKIIDYSEVVPGDIIVLRPGDKVPADARIIQADNLKLNEMILTGEWLASQKKSDVLEAQTPLADRDNMAYMASEVEEGEGKAIVVSIGGLTEVGKISQQILKTKEQKTPLQKKLSRLAEIIGLVILLVSFLIFIVGIARGNTFLEIFSLTVAVMVAAIPEGLPVALTVILALGMRRILRRKGLVRRLLAAETLGSTSIIASDKTLTLTEGKMMVAQVLAGEEIIGKGRPDHLSVLTSAVLANQAFIENPKETMERWILRGSPTDKALLVAAVEAGVNISEIEKQFPKIGSVDFNPTGKYLESFRKTKGGRILFAAGAPENILTSAVFLQLAGRRRMITARVRDKIEEKIGELTKKGFRVIGVSYKKERGKIEDDKNQEGKAKGFTFVGLVALRDPLRPGVKRAIKVCQEAGMRFLMITGDHKLTARAIAKELGIRTEPENIIEGKDIDAMTEQDFAKKIDHIYVYARMEPRHKKKIVEIWQNKGEIVAVTGDGVNDASALKKADIGVALGSGTEVAKEVADLVLLGDNFNIIVGAVEEGRVIIDNIRKVITYLLSGSFSETILLGAVLVLGLPLPFGAAQILWVNFIEDTLPNIALAFEPKEKDVMLRKPERSGARLLTKEMKAFIFVIGFIIDILLLGLFFLLLKYSGYDILHIRTVVFAALATDSLFYALSCKSLRRNIWQFSIFSNKFLLLSLLFGIIVLLTAIYIPFFQKLLHTFPLNLFDWFLVSSIGILSVLMIEFAKWLFLQKKAKIKKKYFAK